MNGEIGQHFIIYIPGDEHDLLQVFKGSEFPVLVAVLYNGVCNGITDIRVRFEVIQAGGIDIQLAGSRLSNMQTLFYFLVGRIGQAEGFL